MDLNDKIAVSDKRPESDIQSNQNTREAALEWKDCELGDDIEQDEEFTFDNVQNSRRNSNKQFESKPGSSGNVELFSYATSSLNQSQINN